MSSDDPTTFPSNVYSERMSKDIIECTNSTQGATRKLNTVIDLCVKLVQVRSHSLVEDESDTLPTGISVANNTEHEVKSEKGSNNMDLTGSCAMRVALDSRVTKGSDGSTSSLLGCKIKLFNDTRFQTM